GLGDDLLGDDEDVAFVDAGIVAGGGDDEFGDVVVLADFGDASDGNDLESGCHASGCLLDVAVGNWPNNLHRMPSRNICKNLLARPVIKDRGAEFVEISHHGRRTVEVQLSAGDGTYSEAVTHTGGNVNERTSRTAMFRVLNEDDVLAFEYEKGLRGVIV